MQLIPYLFFNGNAEEVLEFYRGALGGNVEIMRFAGSPAADYAPADWGSKVLHGRLDTPAGTVCVMDAAEDRAGRPGDNFSISIQVENEGQADGIFSRLIAGGKVMMPLEKTFWSKKFGMLTDKFGIKWMVSCNG